MKEGGNSKDELLEELSRLRQRVAELEAAEKRRDHAEQALRKSEEQLRLIADALPFLISYVDSQQQYRFNNRAYEDWFGHPREAALGKHVRDVLGESAYRAIQEHIEAALLGRKVTYERLVRYRHGSERWINGTYVPHVGRDGKVQGFFALVADISERKRAEHALQKAHDELEGRVHERTAELAAANEELQRQIAGYRRAEQALRQSEEKFRLVAENATDVIWTMDMDLRLTYISPSVTRTRGYTVEEAMRLRLEDIMTPRAFELAARVLKEELALEGTGKADPKRFRVLELEHVCKDGSIVWSEAKMSFVRDPEGRPVGIVGVTRDITERKRAEEKEKQLLRDLSFLSQSAMGFVELSPEDDIYQFIGQRLMELAADALVLVNSYDRATDTVCLRSVLGLSKHASGALRILGRNPVGMTLKMDEEARAALSTGKLVKVPGGFYEFTFRRVPKGVCYAIEKLLGLGDIFSVGFVREGELYGNANIVLRKGAELGRREVIETFMNQAAVALHRKEMEEALAKERNLLRTLIDNLPGCHIFVKDADSRFITTNTTHLKTLGVKTLGDAIGKTDFAFFPRELAQQYYSDEQNVVLSRQPLLGREELVIDRDGKSGWLLTTKVPLRNGHDTVIGLLGISHDITDRKRAEQDRQRLQEQLAHAQKMEALGTLAGGIAHEFNNINAVILGYADLTLQMEELSEAARRNLEIVRRSAERGASLTKSLLVFSRKEVGEKKPVSLGDIVDEVLKMTGKEFTSEGIEVVVKHSLRAPLVMGNPGMLVSVVMNLVVNARHAMLKSPVKRLTVQTGSEKGRPFIRVEDTGCGIPKEHLSKVFTPFFTTKGALAGGEAPDGKARGTGLGLSVCHSIVEGHGGDIQLKSRIGKGTNFTVYLPAMAKREAARREMRATKEQTTPRVLIVDDEEAIANLLADILSHAGHAADSFTDPNEAVEALRRENYAVAFVDLQMPELTGEEFIAAINDLPDEKKPLTVILTGRLDITEEHCASLGAFAALPKPFSGSQVLETVNKALAARKQSSGEKQVPGRGMDK